MIDVVAAVLLDAQGRVLLAQRPPGKHLAGAWEFPGGKIEDGESLQSALARELDEELGIEITGASCFLVVPWHYPRQSVRLHAMRVDGWRGVPRAREGQALAWVAPSDIDETSLAPADVPILAAWRAADCHEPPRQAGTIAG